VTVHTGAETIQGRKLFKGRNYSREETIQGRKLFKGGNYSRAETIRGNTVYDILSIFDESWKKKKERSSCLRELKTGTEHFSVSKLAICIK
jgi:hypothetical protein